MWHRIVDGQIVESVPAFGDEWINALTPGELRERFGWIQGREMPKPSYDQDTEELKLVPVFDPYAGTVSELWQIIPLDTSSPVYVETTRQAEQRFAREYQDLQTLMGMSPQEVADLIDNAFPSMTAAQRRILRAIVVAVRVLIKHWKNPQP